MGAISEIVAVIAFIISVWALFHRSEAVAWVAGVSVIPESLAFWIAWAIIIYGAINLVIIIVVFVALIGASVMALLDFW